MLEVKKLQARLLQKSINQNSQSKEKIHLKAWAFINQLSNYNTKGSH
jgi:hypothetical protein